MFVLTIAGVDSSCHTLEVDALLQKTRFETLGYNDIVLIEKDTFTPPQPE